MKGKMRVLLVAMVLVFSVAMLAGCGDSGSKFDGEWNATKVEAFGEEMSAEEAEMAMTMTIDGDNVTISDGETEDIKGTIEWGEDETGTITMEMTEEEQAEMEELGIDMTMTLAMEEDQLVLDMMGFMKVYFEK